MTNSLPNLILGLSGMKIVDQNPAYQREVKKITKKHNLDDSFLKTLYKSILKNPTTPPDARIV